MLPHREAAWILLIERIRQAADFSEPGAPCDPPVAGGLAAVRSALTEIADALAAHLQGGGPDRAEPPAPAEDLDTLLARAEDFYRTGLAFASRWPALAGGADSRLGLVRGRKPSRAPGAGANRPSRATASWARWPAPCPERRPHPKRPSHPQETLGRTPQEPLVPQDSPPSLWDVTVAATILRASLGASAPPRAA